MTMRVCFCGLVDFAPESSTPACAGISLSSVAALTTLANPAGTAPSAPGPAFGGSSATATVVTARSNQTSPRPKRNIGSLDEGEVPEGYRSEIGVATVYRLVRRAVAPPDAATGRLG